MMAWACGTMVVSIPEDVVRRRTMIGAVVMAAMAATGCNGWIFGLEGSGTASTETRSVADFDAVRLEGQGAAVIEVGPDASLTVEADDNLLPHLTSEVEGGTLVLGTDRQLDPKVPIVFTITVPNLTGLDVTGSGTITTAAVEANAFGASIAGSGNIDVSGLAATSISASITGSGNIDLSDVDTTSVAASVAGSGNVRIGGTTPDLSVRISGSGNFLGSDLVAGSADISVSGSGNAVVNATETLNGDIAGSGSIEYSGDPVVDVSVAGSGQIVQR